MAEKTSAVESLACGLAQIALSSTHFVEENCTEPRNPKCRSATNSPQASPLANHKLDALPKSASLDVLIPEDKSSASNGTHKVKPSKPRRSHSYQPTGKGGYDDHKHKEGLLNFLHSKVQRKKSAEFEYSLHHPKNSEALMELLRLPGVDSNSKNEAGDAPIHAIVKHKRGKRLDLLLTLLTHADVEVNLPGPDGNIALHFAVMVGDELLVKLLITFGGNPSALNIFDDTPLDLALQLKQMNLVDLLVSVGSTTGEVAKHGFYKLPRMRSFHDSSYSPDLNKNQTDFPDGQVGEWNDVESRDLVSSTQSSKSVKIGECVDSQIMYDHLHHSVNRLLEGSGSFSANTDEAIAVTMQQRELLKYKKTKKDQRVFSMKGGSRILCLDGGGIRGLIQIEVLRQIEQATGRRITELFDWIVATSTGGVIALAMVYAKKTLCQLRQLYFKLKDEVFSNDRIGFAYNTEALEKLLKEELGMDMTMNDVKFPRVLITAVNKRTTVPELHFFNNCFGNEFSTQPIWKVARYTSAAPMFFTEFEDYVDGGVLANNPCESGLTAIQNYYRQKEQNSKLDIALVVSVGTGIFPAEVLGKTDAQQFLFFGKHWFKAGDTLKKRAQNLITLLTTALVESESVAQNTKSRLIEQGIPFCRFNPHLDEAIPAGETDIEKLLNMTLQSRIQTMGPDFDELIQLLHLVAELNRQLEIWKKREARIKAACVN